MDFVQRSVLAFKAFLFFSAWLVRLLLMILIPRLSARSDDSTIIVKMYISDTQASGAKSPEPM